MSLMPRDIAQKKDATPIHLRVWYARLMARPMFCTGELAIQFTDIQDCVLGWKMTATRRHADRVGNAALHNDVPLRIGIPRARPRGPIPLVVGVPLALKHAPSIVFAETTSLRPKPPPDLILRVSVIPLLQAPVSELRARFPVSRHV